MAAHRINGVDYDWGPPCETTNGFWACLNEAIFLPNNMTADAHAHDGHRVEWFCVEHNVLEPVD